MLAIIAFPITPFMIRKFIKRFFKFLTMNTDPPLYSNNPPAPGRLPQTSGNVGQLTPINQNTSRESIQKINPRPFKFITKEMLSNREVDVIGNKFKIAETPYNSAFIFAKEKLKKLGYPNADPDKSFMVSTDTTTGEKRQIFLTEMVLLNPQKNKSWFDLKTPMTDKIIMRDKNSNVVNIGLPMAPVTWLNSIWDGDFKTYYLKHVDQVTGRSGYHNDMAFLIKSAFIKTYKIEYQAGKLSDNAMKLSAKAMGLVDEKLGDASSWPSLSEEKIKSSQADNNIKIGLLRINGKLSTDLMTIHDINTNRALLWIPGHNPPLVEFNSVRALKEYIALHAHSPTKMNELLIHFPISERRTTHPFRNEVKKFGVEKALKEIRSSSLSLNATIKLKTLSEPFTDMARRQTERLKLDANELIVSNSDVTENAIKQRLSDINKLVFLFAPLAPVSPIAKGLLHAALIGSGVTEVGIGINDIGKGKVNEGLVEVGEGTADIALAGIGIKKQGGVPNTVTPESLDTVEPTIAEKNNAPSIRGALASDKPTSAELTTKHMREMEIVDKDGSKKIIYVHLTNDDIKSVYHFDSESRSFRPTGQSVTENGQLVSLPGGAPTTPQKTPPIVSWNKDIETSPPSVRKAEGPPPSDLPVFGEYDRTLDEARNFKYKINAEGEKTPKTIEEIKSGTVKLIRTEKFEYFYDHPEGNQKPRLNIVGHGDLGGDTFKGDFEGASKIDSDTMAKELKSMLTGLNKVEPIRLVSCKTGASGFAQSLANKLGRPVIASTESVTLFETGIKGYFSVLKKTVPKWFTYLPQP
ncbi:dermonecrotic toxin domain-containing protein [Cedecea sp.]|jgi:hypothetical protein|uniref:dermonecrotic toxin domain-containing protein n=1 Tax=Cedecea sp. TaxID=1970739 RepID=UPI002F3E2373